MFKEGLESAIAAIPDKDIIECYLLHELYSKEGNIWRDEMVRRRLPLSPHKLVLLKGGKDEKN